MDHKLGWINLICWFGLVVILEILAWCFWWGETKFNDPNTSMTIDEFEQKVRKGSKLVILDDLVLNVENFAKSHPGGRFVLEHNVGRDVSKFFYGGYSMENGPWLSPYRHSNGARKVVNSLIIARLEAKIPTFQARIVDTRKINPNTTTF